MTKLRYGFDPKFSYLDDDGLRKGTTKEAAWAMLEDVQAYLANGKPLPPELKHWLGEAILHSKRSNTEFLQRLGLQSRRGEQKKYSRQFKSHWQGRLWNLGTYNQAGRSTDQIVKTIHDEMTAEGIEVDKQPNRETLQDWFSQAMTGSTRIR
jgi:hypothetical protein